MPNYTCFQDFSGYYQQHLPSCILIGTAFEEDKHILRELLVTGVVQELDGSTLALADLSHRTDSLGLFSFKETLVIDQAEKLSPAIQEFLLRYSKKPHPHLSVWVFTAKPLFFQSFLKKFRGAVSLSLFEEWPSDREKRMALLLTRQATRMDVHCSIAVASAFIKRYAQIKMHHLLGEFHKLLCSIGNKKTLEYADIEGFVVKKEQVSLWKFRDALFQKDRQASRRLLSALLHENREDPLGVLFFLRGQCMYGLRAIEEGCQDRKYRIFRSCGRERLCQMLSDLFYAESIIKNNTQDPILALESFLMRTVCV